MNAQVSSPVNIYDAGGNLVVAGAVVDGLAMAGYLAPAVASLTYGATISVNAQAGNVFAVTLTGSGGTLATPSSPVDGQIIRFRITQGPGGSFTLAYGSAYDFGTTGPPTLSATAGKVDILAFEYVASLSKWCYLGAAIPQGF